MIRPVAADGRIETGGAFTPILRPRVVDRIASAATQRIVLIVAPAGYGKSVALRQYLDMLDAVTLVRYDVHAENGMLLGFVRGLADALLDIAPSARKSLPGAYEKSRSSKTPGLDLAMWMHAHIKTFTGVIAIDDLHIAENDPEVSKFLVSLIERTKGRASWIIASRSSLDLPVGSWLAYGEMDLNIDEQDLRFTIEEAREAAKVSRVGVRDEELSEILAMTEGWPTALGFALRTSTRSVDLRNIAASTREMVYRYLAEQVYHSLDEEQQQLLKFVGYLPEIDLEVLHAAGYTKAKALVEDLRDRVSFIYPDRPGVYRCHDLFRDFLQHQVELEGAFAAERMCLRAAAALETAGYLAPALNVYAQAKASANVLRILEVSGFQLMEQGHADALQTALDVLPQDMRATHPIVLAMRGLGEAHAGRYDRAESLLNRAMMRSEKPELSAALALRLALITINLGRDIVPLLAPFTHLALPMDMQGDLVSLLAIGYANAGQQTEAKSAIGAAEALADEMDDPAQRAKILQRLGVAVKALGMPAATAQLYLTRAVALASESGLFSLTARGYGVLANVALLYDDDLTRAAWYAQQAMSAATKAGDRLGLQAALVQLMNVELTRGNPDRLQKLERQFADAATSDTTRMALLIPARALMVAWEGRFDEAHRLFATVLDRIYDAGDRAYFTAACALALTVDGQRDRAAAHLRTALECIEIETPLAHTRKQIGIARAVCAAAEALAGRATSATRILQRLNAEGGAVIEALREAVNAISRAAKNSALREDALERVQALESIGYGGIAKLLAAAVECSLQTDAAIGGMLTKAELSVLNALAEGQGPKDIALETGRSVYTIQAHIQNITKKLGCSGRNEAITMARRLGLLA
ncbi:MAG TPA: LuxR C-terminal-related transcriptional regulator [Candidatus Baltobacteraceae bacterium]|nr:LuxR C-terminal-related transcriptional regulator [Candidatus Baltobacteraceae bacterium]